MAEHYIPLELFKELIRITKDISQGKRPDPKPLFELTKEGVYPLPITELAESFGIMVVKIEAREFKLRQIIERLKTANQELRATQELLKEQNRFLKKDLRDRFANNLIGSSEAIQRLIRSIEKVADTPLNVLIEGETGTGKELVAKAIHYDSSRGEFPFVALNCGALPESLLESELFGIEKGVATGVSSRMGKIEQAHRGTLFLDEIGDMPLASQVKFLRVLEQRELERIGGRQPLKVDVRVISATNKSLEEEVEKGRFRADLYYRLNVVKIFIPPLRERKEDIPLLVNHFAEVSSLTMKREKVSFSEEAMNLLKNYNWPGNIRELRNEIERCVALASSSIILESDLSEKIQHNSSSVERPEEVIPAAITSGSISLEKIEQEALKRALSDAKGNKSEAARRLGISREGLRKKLIRYNMAVKD
ncbi:MAG: sigma-54 dependent transcriptional regulator [Thermodesulforhabdaceae bacterium]